MAHSGKDKKRKVQRLVDVEVSHVSLVDSPANRTPFKAIKREGESSTEGANSMNITLKNMFGSRPPEVTSVMADTKDKALAVAKHLMEGEGTLEEKEGVFIVTKSGVKADAASQTVHLGKGTGVAYTVSNLKKELALYDMASESFDEALKQEGFVPGLFIGMDALHETIRNAAMQEDTNSPDAFRGKVAKAIEDFSNYVDALIGGLPEKAFKFEKALVALAPNDLNALARPAEGFDAEVYDAIFGEGETAPAAEAATEGDEPSAEGLEAKEGEEAAGEAPEGAQAASEGDPAGEPAAAAPEADPAPANLEELPKSAEETPPVDMAAMLADAMGELTKAVGTQIADAVKPLSDKMANQDATIANLSKAVGGAVASTPEEDDNVVQLSKTDSGHQGGDLPLMDTAYSVPKG